MQRHLTASLLVLAGAGSLSRFLPDPQEAPRPVTRPADLLGRSGDAVLGVLGPPLRIARIAPGFDVWTWRGDDGAVRRVALSDDRVVQVENVVLEGGAAGAVLGDGPYIGQRASELVARRGNPDRVGTIPIHATPGGREVLRRDPALVYGDEWITIVGDRVVRIGAAPVVRQNGPR